MLDNKLLVALALSIASVPASMPSDSRTADRALHIVVKPNSSIALPLLLVLPVIL